MRTRRGALVPGVVLVLLGLYFLAVQLSIPLPGFDMLWPGLIMFGGVLFLAEYAFGRRRDGGNVFVGVGATLLGAFFFLFTLRLPVPLPPLNDGVGWHDMARLWPVFVIIVGLAFLGLWLARPANHGARNLSLLALLAGLVALAINFSLTDPIVIRQIVRLWPLLLVAAGLQMLWQLFRRGQGGSQ